MGITFFAVYLLDDTCTVARDRHSHLSTVP